MKLALLTYDTPHRKTEQVALGLAERGHRGLTLIALPFTPRPARRIALPHRPEMGDGAAPRPLAAALGADLLTVPDAGAIPVTGFDYYLITGAGLLPEGFVQATAGRVVNAHPGIIPLVRGLDALKWAILDDMPLGNSLHFIDAQADAGEVITVLPTPVIAGDTFERLARRHYEREIAMMIDFERHLQAPRPAMSAAARPARMRMNAETEGQMSEAFPAYVARHAGGPVTNSIEETAA